MTLTYQRFTAAAAAAAAAAVVVVVVVVVDDLWQSLSEWHLLVCACVLVCRRENVAASIRAADEHYLQRVETKSERCWCRFRGISYERKQQFTAG
jgi:hypothetical protein